MRPGSTTLTVMPSLATSPDRVFDHPTIEERSAFEITRFGIGCTTPVEATVRMRPHLRSRMPGSTRPASRNTGTTMASNCGTHSSGCTVSGVRAGGPPVLATRMSTPPSSFIAAAWIASTLSLRSPTKVEARPGPFLPIASAASFSRSPLRAVISTCAPSAASASAMPRPRPRLEDRTMARLPARPRSMAGSDCVGRRATAPGWGLAYSEDARRGNRPSGLARTLALDLLLDCRAEALEESEPEHQESAGDEEQRRVEHLGGVLGRDAKDGHQGLEENRDRDRRDELRQAAPCIRGGLLLAPVQHLLLDEELGDVEDGDRNDDVADRAEEGDLALRPGAEELDHRIIQPLQDQPEGEEHQDEAREAEHGAGKKLHQRLRKRLRFRCYDSGTAPGQACHDQRSPPGRKRPTSTCAPAGLVSRAKVIGVSPRQVRRSTQRHAAPRRMLRCRATSLVAATAPIRCSASVQGTWSRSQRPGATRSSRASRMPGAASRLTSRSSSCTGVPSAAWQMRSRSTGVPSAARRRAASALVAAPVPRARSVMAWRAPARSISAEMSQISNTARSAEHAATTVPDLRFRSTRPSPARLASARLTVIRDTPKRAISACSDGTLRPGGHDPARIGRAIARRICRCSGPSPSSARSSGITRVPPRSSPPPCGEG